MNSLKDGKSGWNSRKNTLYQKLYNKRLSKRLIKLKLMRLEGLKKPLNVNDSGDHSK